MKLSQNKVVPLVSQIYLLSLSLQKGKKSVPLLPRIWLQLSLKKDKDSSPSCSMKLSGVIAHLACRALLSMDVQPLLNITYHFITVDILADGCQVYLIYLPESALPVGDAMTCYSLLTSLAFHFTVYLLLPLPGAWRNLKKPPSLAKQRQKNSKTSWRSAIPSQICSAVHLLQYTGNCCVFPWNITPATVGEVVVML